MSAQADSLTLVTHNAYWFQGAPSVWGEERVCAHAAVVQALAVLYSDLDPDMICLQEVPSAEVCIALRVQLGMEGAFSPGGQRTDYGGALLWKGRSARVENLTHTAVGQGRTFERICLKLDTSIGARRLSIVNVHLSSNRYAPAHRGEPLRLAELAALFVADPAPDVVTGDFNGVPDSAVYADMMERGFVDCGRHYSTHGRAPDKRVDYIWVRADSGLSVSEYEVVEDERFFYDAGIYLSDHHPLCARLQL